MNEQVRNIAIDLLWVAAAVVGAYLGLKYDSRPADIGFERVVSVAFFILCTAMAVGFFKQTIADFAKLLRESAARAREKSYGR